MLSKFLLTIYHNVSPRYQNKSDSHSTLNTSSGISLIYAVNVYKINKITKFENAKKKFLIWPFLPIVLNLFMVLGMLLAFYNSLDITKVLAYSVIIAGFVQFIFIFLRVKYLKIKFVVAKREITQYVKKFFILLFPNLLAGGVVQINQLVGVIFAASIPGAISWRYYADRIGQLPLGIFIISISTILLTNLSSPDVKKKIENINFQIERSLEVMLGISFLSCIGLLVFSELIVDILFRRGQFGYGDVKATSDAIIMYAIGLPAFGLIKIFSTVFFSYQDTKIPFRISFFSMLINILGIFFLIRDFGHLGIALSLSLSSWINAIILYIFIF